MVREMCGSFLEEMIGVSKCWSSTCLAKFSHCLGMSIEGFEGEILMLLKKMKERKDEKGKGNGRRRKQLESSRGERELKKLEWPVNYLGTMEESGGSVSNVR